MTYRILLAPALIVAALTAQTGPLADPAAAKAPTAPTALTPSQKETFRQAQVRFLSAQSNLNAVLAELFQTPLGKRVAEAQTEMQEANTAFQSATEVVFKTAGADRNKHGLTTQLEWTTRDAPATNGPTRPNRTVPGR